MKRNFQAGSVFVVLVGLLLWGGIYQVDNPNAQSSNVCPNTGDGWVKIDSDDLSLYPVEEATAYCFKAGNYLVYEMPEGGFGQEGACSEENVHQCGLSHWSYYVPSVTPTPTPTQEPTPTPTDEPGNGGGTSPTPTSAPVPTEEPGNGGGTTPSPTVAPTNTPAPTATSTPNPTSTPSPEGQVLGVSDEDAGRGGPGQVLGITSYGDTGLAQGLWNQVIMLVGLIVTMTGVVGYKKSDA